MTTPNMPEPNNGTFPHNGQLPPPSHPPTGYPPTGQPPSGYPPTGQPPTGYPPTGQPPAGYPPTGYPPTGQPPTGYPPTGQPPAGQPPVGNYGQQPAPSGYGIPVPPNKSTNSNIILGIVGVVSVLLVIGGGFFIINHLFNNNSALAEVGNCVNITGATNNNDVEIVECTRDAMYEVAMASSGDPLVCPNDYYTDFREDGKTVLCMIPHLEKSLCYLPGGDTNAVFVIVDCATAVNDEKVFEIVDILDSANAQSCPASSYGIEYPVPGKTYCIY